MPSRKGSSKSLLIVSDLHCGSIYGLLPPDMITSDGRSVPPNPGQQYLWECWQVVCELAASRGVDAVIVNGDVVDGRQRAQRGSELCLPLVEDQARAAEQALLYLRKYLPAAKWYFVQGTEYHDATAGREVEVVARALGAVSYHGVGSGRYSREVLDLDVDGVIVNCAHHISVSSGLYRATAPDREALWSALAGKTGKMPRADLLVRSHAHYFVHVEHESKHIVITPCWQLQTRYMRRHSVYRMLPSIGAIVVYVEPEAKRIGYDPVRIEKVLFPLPPLRPVKL